MIKKIKKIKDFFNHLSQPLPLEKNFESYDSYWRSRGFNAPSMRRAEVISKYVDKGKKILDVGCGDGTMIKFLTKENKPKKVLGIDISEVACEHVKAQGYEAKVINILDDSFIKLLKSEDFDYIIITEVLEHIQEPEFVIENIKKYQPDAILFISIPNAGFIMHRLRLLFGQFPTVMIQQHIKEHIRFWTYKDFFYWAGFLGYNINLVEPSFSTKPFGLDLGKICPSLFARQIIFCLDNVGLDSKR